MTPRKTFWLLVPLLAMSALFSISRMIEAQGGSPSGEIGVEVGDWGNYDSSLLTYESNIPGYEKLPIWLEAIESTQWFTFEVVEITGISVTIQFGTYYEDGTKQFATLTGDPVAGSGNLGDGLAPADLRPGDQFYIWLEEYGYEGSRKVTVGETISRTYAGESREVNHVTLSLPIIEEGREVGSRSFEYYFDKETGICVDEFLSTSVVSPGGYLRYSWSVVMTATSLWGPASAVIPDPQLVTEANPVIIAAAETANIVISITNISDPCMIKMEIAAEAPQASSGLQILGNSIFINTSKSVTTTAVLRLPYDPAELLEKRIVESSLTIHYWDGSAWVPVESHVNAEEHYISAEIDHFSYWALMGETASPTEEAVPVAWIIVLVVGVVVAVLCLLYFHWRRKRRE